MILVYLLRNIKRITRVKYPFRSYINATPKGFVLLGLPLNIERIYLFPGVKMKNINKLSLIFGNNGLYNSFDLFFCGGRLRQ